MKTCTGCGHTKQLDLFAWRNRSKGTRASRCLACTRSGIREHYTSNKAYYLDKAKRQRAAKQQELWEFVGNYLLTHPCVDCGETDLRVLEFDHVRGTKLFDISSAVRDQRSLDSVVHEIAKCEVRCANHHRIVTAERAGWRSHRVYASVSALASNQLKQ